MKQRNSDELRKLACWARASAERVGNPIIRKDRLRRAEELEEEAARDKVGTT